MSYNKSGQYFTGSQTFSQGGKNLAAQKYFSCPPQPPPPRANYASPPPQIYLPLLIQNLRRALALFAPPPPGPINHQCLILSDKGGKGSEIGIGGFIPSLIDSLPWNFLL